LNFKGKDSEEVGVVTKCNNKAYQLKQGTAVVAIDKDYYRPTEVDQLIGNPEKAMKLLGWKPKYGIGDIIKEMVNSDIELFKRDKYLKEGGHKVLDYHE